MRRSTLVASLCLLFISAGCSEAAPFSPPDPWGEAGFVPGAPLSHDEDDDEVWIYTPIEGMVCGDGTPSGIFTNITSRSRELVFFLMGGGICYDTLSCSLLEGNLKGLGPDPLASFLAHNRDELGIFDRSAEDNPFKDASFVVLPHCTGDFHLADTLVEHPSLGTIHQRGRANLMRVARRVVPTFADASRITIAGFSAGGVGVTGSYHLLASAFGTTEAPLPFLINDSGPLVRAPYLNTAGQGKIAAQWKLEESLFDWCPKCESQGFHEVFAALHAIYPGLRSSLICTYNDGIVTALYGLIASFQPPLGDFLREGLLDYSAWSEGIEYAGGEGAHRQFYYEGTRHGVLEVAVLAETPGLTEFLHAQLEGDRDFQTVH